MRKLVHEPVVVGNLVRAALVLAASGGVAALTDVRIEAMVGVTVALLGVMGFLAGAERAAVAPVAKVEEIAGELGGTAVTLVERLTGKVLGAVDPRGEKGGVVLFVLIVGAAVVLLGVAIDVCWEDQSERNDIGLALVVPADNNDENEGNQGGSGECAENKGQCSDDDLSPRFDDSPVDRSFNPVVCLPMSTCNFEGESPPEEGAPA